MAKKENDRLVPKLRFKGFTDDWMQEKLSNLYSFSNGINTAKENYEKGRKMISVMDILSKEYLYYNNIINSVDVSANIQKSNKVEKGDLVFVRSSETKEDVGWAKTYRADKYSLFSGFVIRGIKENNLNSFFIESSLNYSNRKQIESKANGSTRYNIGQKSLQNIELSHPALEEQSKISKTLEILDNLITLEQEKIDSLMKIKRYLINNILSQQNVSPFIRFDKFESNWERKVLSDISEISLGQSPNSKNYTTNPKDIILVQGNADLKNGVVFPRVWTTQVTRVANKGDIILTVRAPVGEVAISQYNVVLGRGVAGIKGNKFLYYLLIQMREGNFWKKYSTGSTFESINSKDIKQASVFVPLVTEQKKIAKMLTTIDNIISNEEQKLKSYSESKKLLLDLLFI